MLNFNREIPLIKSPFIQTAQNENKIIIWHSLFGNPKIISKEMREFIEIFSIPKNLKSLYEEYEISQNEEKCIKNIIKDYYLIPEEFNERLFLAEKMKERELTISQGLNIDNLGLIISELCNFRCTYCIHFNNIEMSARAKNSKKIMSFETTKKAVNFFVDILRKNKKKTAEINFGGGEPLLNWTVIKQILNYCKLKYKQEFDFRFSINTNASLITCEIAKVLKQYSVEVASSLDGPKKGNNKIRLTKHGYNTFELITKGFKKLATQNYPIKGIAVTVNDKNFDYIEEKFIDWATEQGLSSVRIDIDVIGMVKIPVKNIVEKLLKIKRYAEKQEITVAGFWSRPKENMNESTLNEHVAFCGAVRGNTICISPSENIYSCGYSTTQLGNLDEKSSFLGPNEKYCLFVKNHLTGNIEMCKGCAIEGQCAGGCNITQEFACATKNMKVERMCEFYRIMTQNLLLE